MEKKPARGCKDRRFAAYVPFVHTCKALTKRLKECKTPTKANKQNVYREQHLHKHTSSISFLRAGGRVPGFGLAVAEDYVKTSY